MMYANPTHPIVVIIRGSFYDERRYFFQTADSAQNFSRIRMARDLGQHLTAWDVRLGPIQPDNWESPARLNFKLI